jgi:hypothetical protein
VLHGTRRRSSTTALVASIPGRGQSHTPVQTGSSCPPEPGRAMPRAKRARTLAGRRQRPVEDEVSPALLCLLLAVREQLRVRAQLERIGSDVERIDARMPYRARGPSARGRAPRTRATCRGCSGRSARLLDLSRSCSWPSRRSWPRTSGSPLPSLACRKAQAAPGGCGH